MIHDARIRFSERACLTGGRLALVFGTIGEFPWSKLGKLPMRRKPFFFCIGVLRTNFRQSFIKGGPQPASQKSGHNF
jgi:hypothetical protein